MSTGFRTKRRVDSGANLPATILEFKNDLDRGTFLKWSAILGGATVLTAAGCNKKEKTKKKTTGGVDVEILNYALTLEFLEADFYARGLQKNILQGRELDLVKPIKAHEDAHVAAIRALLDDLGATAAEEPEFTYPAGTFDGRDMFLKTALTFEELGVGAYHGQVTRIESPAILLAAASIAGVESRHAAILNDLTAQNPFPAPVEVGKDMATVLAAAQSFIVAKDDDSNSEQGGN